MIIKNRKTGIESVVSPEEWESIKNNPILKDRFTLTDSKEIREMITAGKKPIIATEVLDFKNRKIAELKNKESEEKTSTEKQSKKKK